MNKLFETLQSFNLRNTTEKTIQDEFMIIADIALNEGYFLVNKKKKIYPVEIEFYVYGERESDQDQEWMCDFNMLHRHYDKINRKNPVDDKDNYVDYFPEECSLYPHKYGVDVTFEKESLQYRASFLIKKYRIDDPMGEIQEETTYLSEEMFGYAPFGKDGLQLDIIWVDDPSVRTGIQDPQPRIKFHKKNNELDKKKWRFTKQEWPA